MGRTSVLVSIIFLILSSSSVNAFQRIDGSLYVTANVGIGTSLPRSALDMSSGCITLGNDTQCAWPSSGGDIGAGTTNYMTKYVGVNTLGPSSVVEISGNVGVGSVTPNKKLDIVGEVAVTVDQSIYLDGSSGDTFSKYNSSSAYTELWTDGTKRIEF